MTTWKSYFSFHTRVVSTLAIIGAIVGWVASPAPAVELGVAVFITLGVVGLVVAP